MAVQTLRYPNSTYLRVYMSTSQCLSGVAARPPSLSDAPSACSPNLPLGDAWSFSGWFNDTGIGLQMIHAFSR